MTRTKMLTLVIAGLAVMILIAAGAIRIDADRFKGEKITYAQTGERLLRAVEAAGTAVTPHEVENYMIQYAAVCEDGEAVGGFGVVEASSDPRKMLELFGPDWAASQCELERRGSVKWPRLYRIAGYKFIPYFATEPEARAAAEEAFHAAISGVPDARIIEFRYDPEPPVKVFLRVEANGREAVAELDQRMWDDSDLERLAHEVTTAEITRLAAVRGLTIEQMPTYEDAVAAAQAARLQRDDEAIAAAPQVYELILRGGEK